MRSAIPRNLPMSVPPLLPYGVHLRQVGFKPWSVNYCFMSQFCFFPNCSSREVWSNLFMSLFLFLFTEYGLHIISNITRYGRFTRCHFWSMWHLGWFGMVQNTHTGCGDDLPIILKISKNHKNNDFVRAPFYTHVYIYRRLGGVSSPLGRPPP